MVKMDLEKAYDKVSWDFLLHTLELLHFPATTMKLIALALNQLPFRYYGMVSKHGLSNPLGEFAKETLYPPSYLCFTWKDFPS